LDQIYPTTLYRAKIPNDQSTLRSFIWPRLIQDARTTRCSHIVPFENKMAERERFHTYG